MIEVVNKHHGKQGHYIGRGTPLGNPFSHMKGTKAKYQVATRAEAIQKYTEWMKDRLAEREPSVIGELSWLLAKARKGDLHLLCFCAPLPCHGDVIKAVLDEALEFTAELNGQLPPGR